MIPGFALRSYLMPKEIIKIEFYSDSNPEKPSAYERYLVGIKEQDFSPYKTIILDSFSSALRSARWWEQFINLPNAKGKEKMKWWGESADRLERNIAGPFKSFQCNTIVIGHVGSKQDDERGSLHWGVDATGRLSTSLPRDFGEVYLADVARDREGRKKYIIQTEKDDRYFAKTHLGIRDSFETNYGEGYFNLVTNSKKIQLIRDNHFITPLHILLYGDSGAGKSQFAASFPKPMLVFMWDGFDNAIPYLEQGEPSPIEEYEDGPEGDRTQFQVVHEKE